MRPGWKLLNPKAKHTLIDNTIDEEIYEAVIKLREGEENTVINCRDDDIDKDAIIKPNFTHQDVLPASAIITRYIDNLNDPLAHKLEVLLGSFTCLI
jgi:hypothetical protein